MRVHCGYCGMDWEVYKRDDLHGQHARQCPHCDSKVDPSTWRDAVLPAFAAAEKANTSLFTDHVEGHKPIYTVAFIPDHIFE